MVTETRDRAHAGLLLHAFREQATEAGGRAVFAEVRLHLSRDMLAQGWRLPTNSKLLVHLDCNALAQGRHLFPGSKLLLHPGGHRREAGRPRPVLLGKSGQRLIYAGLAKWRGRVRWLRQRGKGGSIHGRKRRAGVR